MSALKCCWRIISWYSDVGLSVSLVEAFVWIARLHEDSLAADSLAFFNHLVPTSYWKLRFRRLSPDTLSFLTKYENVPERLPYNLSIE